MKIAFDPYAIEHATLRAKLLCSTAGFPADAADDVRQELLLDYFRRSSKFDSERGDTRAFIRGVMQHHACVLVKRHYRRIKCEVLAEDLVTSPIKDGEEVLEITNQRDPVICLHTAIDVQRILQTLPDNLQRLALLLMDTPANEIRSITGRSRSRIYQMTRQLQSAFVQANLGRGRARPRVARQRETI